MNSLTLVTTLGASKLTMLSCWTYMASTGTARCSVSMGGTAHGSQARRLRSAVSGNSSITQIHHLCECFHARRLGLGAHELQPCAPCSFGSGNIWRGTTSQAPIADIHQLAAREQLLSLGPLNELQQLLASPAALHHSQVCVLQKAQSAIHHTAIHSANR